MADSSPSESTDESGARIEITPDALHEGEEGLYVDCPECGSVATIRDVVMEGRCRSRLSQDAAETVEEDAELPCSAELTLELVWES